MRTPRRKCVGHSGGAHRQPMNSQSSLAKHPLDISWAKPTVGEDTMTASDKIPLISPACPGLFVSAHRRSQKRRIDIVTPILRLGSRLPCWINCSDLAIKVASAGTLQSQNNIYHPPNQAEEGRSKKSLAPVLTARVMEGPPPGTVPSQQQLVRLPSGSRVLCPEF